MRRIVESFTTLGDSELKDLAHALASQDYQRVAVMIGS